MLWASAAAPVAVLHGAQGSILDAPPLQQWAAAGLTLMLLLAGAAVIGQPRLGRITATFAILGTLALGASHLIRSPLATLTALLAGSVSLALLWKVGESLGVRAGERRRAVYEGQTQGAAIAALSFWLTWIFFGTGGSLVGTFAVGWGMALGVLLAIEWVVRNRKQHRRRAQALAASIIAASVLALLLWGHWWWMMSTGALVAATTSVLVRRPVRLEVEQNSWWEPLLGHPERLFVGTFAGLCLGGTVLLALPQSAASGESVGLVDAAFTATSAVCVTGLIVLDTPVDFSGLGQAFILLLFQIGGLGIMTFSTAAMWALGRRLSLRHEGAVASLISTRDRGRLFGTARGILKFTVISEGLGTLMLAGMFASHGDGVGMALWRGFFTAVSAFCNAGFALQSNSLVPYQESPMVLHIVGVLIILGGLSPLAVFALPDIVKRSTRPVSAQARLSLISAAVLLGVGFLFYLGFEWEGSLGHLSIADRIHNAWFQSVTLRTAGFNSVDISIVRPATLTLMLLWMFTGGSPGGTAGGVKTTTMAVLALSVVHAIRGQWTLEVFGKKVPERTRTKAAVTVAVAATTGVLALVAIQLTQSMDARLAVFEVVSALGTVGLSIGGTGKLDGIGKAIILVCMFVGRVGGLTLLMFLSSRRPVPTIGRPEEAIDVG